MSGAYDYDQQAARPLDDESAISRALNDLEKNVMFLHEALDVLYNRLERVTQPAEVNVQAVPYDRETELAQRAKPVSPVVEQLRSLSERVDRDTSRLRDVMSRLDT